MDFLFTTKRFINAFDNSHSAGFNDVLVNGAGGKDIPLLVSQFDLNIG